MWGQTLNKHISRIQKFQNKAIRIISFADFKDSSTPLYHKLNILKLEDHVNLQNFLFVHNSLNGSLPFPLLDCFEVASDTFNSRGSLQSKIVLPKVRTVNYGLNSIRYRSASFWNLMVSKFPKEKFNDQSKYSCKKVLSKHLIDGYSHQTI